VVFRCLALLLIDDDHLFQFLELIYLNALMGVSMVRVDACDNIATGNWASIMKGLNGMVRRVARIARRRISPT
jgi:hypothetical protein